MQDPVTILGIETSCDETAAAVVQDGREIRSNIVASQAEMHAKYGGVFPEMASRQHIKTIQTVVREALDRAGFQLQEMGAIAVTQGPGLPGSLVVGLNMAKGLSISSGVQLIGVNHLEGHLYSAFLGDNQQAQPDLPLVALIVSGGHTELVLMREHLAYQRLGGTLDDAAGEAFDKVARLLDLGYPGGPRIQKAAETGDPARFHFPRALQDRGFDFSFSGLKTAVLREVRSQEDQSGDLPAADLAASFQAAVVDILVEKTLFAAESCGAKSIVVAGGVSANGPLRQKFLADSPVPVFIPPLFLCTDNAAMIAAAGYRRLRVGQVDSLAIDALPNWPLTEIGSG